MDIKIYEEDVLRLITIVSRHLQTLITSSTQLLNAQKLLGEIRLVARKIFVNATFVSYQYTKDLRSLTRWKFILPLSPKSQKIVVNCGNIEDIRSDSQTYPSYAEEHAQAQRLLLISKRQIQVLLEDCNYIYYSGSYLPGRLTLNKLSFLLYNGNNQHQEQNWFVTLCKCEDKIFSTEIVRSNENGKIKFTNSVVFASLKAGFQIDVELYCLERVNKNYEKEPEQFSINDYAFQLWCIYSIETENIGQKDAWAFNYLSQQSVVDTFSVKIKGDVEPDCFKSGYLRIGKVLRIRIEWNYYYCVLTGSCFKYFKNRYAIEPVGVIDLHEEVLIEPLSEYPNNSITIRTDTDDSCSYCGNLCGLLPSRKKNETYILKGEDDINDWYEKLNEVVISTKLWKKCCKVR